MTDRAQRRAASVLAHLAPLSQQAPLAAPLADAPVLDYSPLAATLDAKCDAHAEIAAALYANFPEYRAEVNEALKDPLFRPRFELALDDQRELTLERLKHLAAKKIFEVRDFGSRPNRILTLFETLYACDPAMSVKTGVQFALFGAALMALGTAKHHKYADAINSLAMPGAFAMTELGHGSNVQGVETLAVYDKATQEFVMSTPTTSAQKYWLGNAAKHGQWAVVFAQLEIDRVDYGVHVFLVRIRDKDGNPMPNVRCADNGHKHGLNGIDNGRIWFDQTRVSRDALLDKLAQVDADGTYHSEIKDKVKRFAAMIAPLVAGRVTVSMGAVIASRIALFAAVRYGFQRTQFVGANSKNEVPIMSYLSHQRRLYPHLATVYAHSFALIEARKLVMANPTPQQMASLHEFISGVKPVTTWLKTETLQNCRECCGGQGFSSYNQIAVFRADTDIDLTFEGDNTVLMQQVTRPLLMRLAKGQLKPVAAPSVTEQNALSWDTLQALFAWREFYLLGNLAAAMKKDMSSGKTEQQAFEAHLDLVVDAGKAHIEKRVLSVFAAHVSGMSAAAKAVLSPLVELYAVFRMKADMTSFVAGEALRIPLVRKYDQLFNELLGRVHEVALPLVNAFDLPRHIAYAPIAYDYIAANRYEVSRNGPNGLYML